MADERLNYLEVSRFTVLVGGNSANPVIDAPVHACVLPDLLGMDTTEMPGPRGSTIMVATGDKKIDEVQFRYFQSESDAGLLHRRMLEWLRFRENKDVHKRYLSFTVKALSLADIPVIRWAILRCQLVGLSAPELVRASGGGGTFIERTVRVLPEDYHEALLDSAGNPIPEYDTEMDLVLT